MSRSPRYVRARRIAELLGVNVRTVRRWIADGLLPSVKVGGARLVAEADLRLMLQPEAISAMSSESPIEFADISMS